MRAAWERLSLRVRLLLIGLAGLATALAVGGVALYTVLTVVSYRMLDASAQATGREVADLVDQHRLPDPIPVTGGQIVQVVDSRDRVVSASVNADRLTALLLPSERRTAAAGHVVVPGSRMGTTSALRTVATPAGPGRRYTVLVAQPVDDIVHSQRILGVTLLATYPCLLAVLALIAWRAMGATLRPVETLRSSAERISGTDQDTRLPVPPSQDEIHRLAVTLNSMLARLEHSRARQRSFVADAAHELRSPLASMQTQIDVHQRVDGPSWQMQELEAEVRRMTRLVDDLLVLARLDAPERPTSTLEPVDVVAIAQEVTGRLEDRGPVSATVRARSPVFALSRADDLRRVLGNLVDNAVRHARSTVEVRAFESAGQAVVEVCDDGVGIAEADRERVFERFTRLDEGRARDAGGSGLGLAIVREIVQRQGGVVELDDSSQGGLTARLRLPSRS
ncbi:MAG: sensor histidine kinase [Nocardioidaceae bacterium]